MNAISVFLKSAFTDWVPKDWITFFASLVAIILAIVTYLQRSGESRIAIRKQLTDLLEKLASLNTEVSKYRTMQSKDNYPPNYIGLMNDQRRFMVRQAEFLASKIPKLVAPYEYLVLAGAFAGIDDTLKAEQNFKKAIETSDPIEKGIALRGYARYLFNEDKKNEARQYYEKAIQNFQGPSNILISYRANTFERQAQQEEEWGLLTKAKDLLVKAFDEYNKISKEDWRNNELPRIFRLIAKIEEKENMRVGTPPEKQKNDDVSKSDNKL